MYIVLCFPSQVGSQTAVPALIDAVIPIISFLSGDELSNVFRGCASAEFAPDMFIQMLVDCAVSKRTELVEESPRSAVEILNSCASLNIKDLSLLEGMLLMRTNP